MSRRPSAPAFAPPSTDAYTQTLMQQNAQRQQQLEADQKAYQQQIEQQRQEAAASVAAQQAKTTADIQKKVAQPVSLGTLMTSPMGIFGNPVLSATKLSG